MTIIGMGNHWRGDDAAGLIAARCLREKLPEARVLELEGDVAAAMEAWGSDTSVVLIDAVRTGAPPGTILRLEAHAAPLSAVSFRCSTHSMSLADAIELARSLGRLPPRVIVYGIEAESFEAGAPLAPRVAAAVTRLVDRVIREEVGRV